MSGKGSRRRKRSKRMIGREEEKEMGRRGVRTGDWRGWEGRRDCRGGKERSENGSRRT